MKPCVDIISASVLLAVIHCKLVIAVIFQPPRCLNGGTAVPNRPFCSCLRPFAGDFCQRHSPCGANGVIGIGLRCQCDEHWTGVNCTERICVHGRRIQSSNECQCPLGYEGEFCEMVNRCAQHGQLQDGRCNCEADWLGDFCEAVDCRAPFGRPYDDGRKGNDSCECYERRQGLTCRECVYPYYGDDCSHRKTKLFVVSMDIDRTTLFGILLPLLITALCLMLIYCCCCRTDLLSSFGSYKTFPPDSKSASENMIHSTNVNTPKMHLLMHLPPPSKRSTDSENGQLPIYDQRYYVGIGPTNIPGVHRFPVNNEFRNGNTFSH